jgi:predicted nucleotide-binding protein
LTQELVERNASAGEAKRGRKAGAIYFPRYPLKDVLNIAEAIWAQNAGNPFDILDVAKSVGQSPTSSAFVVRLAASFRYGLTEGSPTTKVISLTALGSSIVAPIAGADVNAQLRRALLFSPIFQKVYSWMDRKPIPREDVFRNTLMKPPELGGFGIPKEDVEDFVKVFVQNIADYRLADDVQNTRYLRLDKLSPTESAMMETQPRIDESFEPTIEGTQVIPKMGAGQPPPTSPPVTSRVFISHSKNMKILGQLKQMLTFGGFEAEIAQERETTAIPIPQKVFDGMRKCNCAVINVSADEQEKRDGDTYGINQNVLIEIGAAFLLYDKKVILLVDRRIKLPSNLQGLAILPYDGDELSWDTGMRLQEALTGFRSKL